MHLDIVLLDEFALKHGVKVNQGDGGKDKDGGDDADDVFVPLKKVVFHISA